jgi:hypothetical protein
MISNKVKFSAVALTVLLAVAPITMAREFADIYSECGLGAMIFPDNKTGAVITNITSDLGTTAFSSDISSPDTCKGGQAKTAAFIHDSYESLERDIARGQGEYLDTLMMLAGVSRDAQKTILSALRDDFASYVASQDYTSQTQFQKAESLYNILYSQLDASIDSNG